MGKCTVIPDVPVVREAVAYKAQAAFLNILLDGVERLLFRDFHFGISPTRDFDDHVEDAIALVGEEWDIVERRDDRSVLFDVNSMV